MPSEIVTVLGNPDLGGLLKRRNRNPIVTVPNGPYIPPRNKAINHIIKGAMIIRPQKIQLIVMNPHPSQSNLSVARGPESQEIQ